MTTLHNYVRKRTDRKSTAIPVRPNRDIDLCCRVVHIVTSGLGPLREASPSATSPSLRRRQVLSEELRWRSARFSRNER
jgi:hypothetical protein